MVMQLKSPSKKHKYLSSFRRKSNEFFYMEPNFYTHNFYKKLMSSLGNWKFFNFSFLICTVIRTIACCISTVIG